MALPVLYHIYSLALTTTYLNLHQISIVLSYFYRRLLLFQFMEHYYISYCIILYCCLFYLSQSSTYAIVAMNAYYNGLYYYIVMEQHGQCLRCIKRGVSYGLRWHQLEFALVCKQQMIDICATALSWILLNNVLFYCQKY